jgi:hypothetical protein
MVVKTQEEERVISDLAETFDNLRKFKMKLNTEKYIRCAIRKITWVYDLSSRYLS